MHKLQELGFLKLLQNLDEFNSRRICKGLNNLTLSRIFNNSLFLEIVVKHAYVGIIKKSSGFARSIDIIDKKISKIVKGIELPLLGYIAAGSPIEPYTDPNASFTVSPNMVSANKKSYVLQVRGQSMIEEGILDESSARW